MKQTLILFMQDEPGVLNRIASLVRRRNFNIESIVAGRTEKEGITRMTLVVNEPDLAKRKTIYNNIRGLVDVYDVVDATGENCHIREHALVKVSVKGKEIKEIDIEIDVFNTLFGYKKTNLLFGYRVLDEVDSELLLDAFEIADHTFDSKNKKKKTTLKSNQKPAVNTTSKIVPIGKGTVFVTKGTVQQKDIVIKQTEKSLVNRFKAFLKKNKQGKLVKNQIKIKGENRPQETDGWIDSSKTLIEAKASPTRENIRMAIGQLLDYKRHHKPVPKRLAVLLPTFPRKDLADLLRSQKIDIIYEKNNKFVTKKNK